MMETKKLPLRGADKLYVPLLLGIAFLWSCQSASEQSGENTLTTKAITVQPNYAKGFALDDYGNYQILHILQPFNDKQDTIDYLLYPKNSPKPEGFEQLITITTPIERMVLESTTQVAMATKLGMENKIIGMTSTAYIYEPTIRERVAKKEITEVGAGEQLNREQLMVMHPDVMMVSGFSSASYHKNYKSLADVGIPILINSEWMEKEPLGRVEWLKIFGYLIGEPQKAAATFQEIEQAYLKLAKLGRAASTKPLVIGGLPYKGSWSIAGANSYVTKLLTDAGATWVGEDNKSTATQLMDFESVYLLGQKADYWLRLSTVQSKSELLSIDPRFADFKAYQNGNLYNNNKRLTPDGAGNDYWESGTVNPHIILADILKIIHPELLLEHQLFYYQQIQ